MAIEPRWDTTRESAPYLPTGKLTLKQDSLVLHQERGLIKLDALAVDELGAEWDVSYAQGDWDMTHPVKYPAQLRGMYHLKGEYHTEYIVLADSFEAAVRKVIEQYKYSDVEKRYQEALKAYTLERVSKPLPEAKLRNGFARGGW